MIPQNKQHKSAYNLVVALISNFWTETADLMPSIVSVYYVPCGGRVVVDDPRLSHLMTKRAIYPCWLFKKSTERCDFLRILNRMNRSRAAGWNGLNPFVSVIVPDSMPIASIPCSISFGLTDGQTCRKLAVGHPG